jgi:hypothetical protein
VTPGLPQEQRTSENIQFVRTASSRVSLTRRPIPFITKSLYGSAARDWTPKISKHSAGPATRSALREGNEI